MMKPPKTPLDKAKGILKHNASSTEPICISDEDLQWLVDKIVNQHQVILSTDCARDFEQTVNANLVLFEKLQKAEKKIEELRTEIIFLKQRAKGDVIRVNYGTSEERRLRKRAKESADPIARLAGRHPWKIPQGGR